MSKEIGSKVKKIVITSIIMWSNTSFCSSKRNSFKDKVLRLENVLRESKKKPKFDVL